MREVLEGERKINSEKPIILPPFYPFLRHLALQVSFGPSTKRFAINSE